MGAFCTAVFLCCRMCQSTWPLALPGLRLQFCLTLIISVQTQPLPSFWPCFYASRDLLWYSLNTKIPHIQFWLGAEGRGEGCQALHEPQPSQEERQVVLGYVQELQWQPVPGPKHHISCSGIYMTVVSSKPATGYQPWIFFQTWTGINAIKTGIPTSKPATWDTRMLPMSWITHPCRNDYGLVTFFVKTPAPGSELD